MSNRFNASRPVLKLTLGGCYVALVAIPLVLLNKTAITEFRLLHVFGSYMVLLRDLPVRMWESRLSGSERDSSATVIWMKYCGTAAKAGGKTEKTNLVLE